LVKSSADALLGIINEILDFSKIEAGRLDFESIPFSLRDTLSTATRTLASKAKEKGLVLRFSVTDATPDAYQGDPLRLRQILINLIGNALKFTERGEIEVSARVEQSDGVHAELHFSVRDTGIGIPADKQKLIFEAFSQADNSTTRKFGGTGLGLTICQRLVELMQGRIWVESQPGVGSTFQFTTRLEQLTGLPEAAAVVPRRVAVHQAGRQFAILLAEDNPVNQTLAVRVLEKLGHRVRVVGNGADAVAAVKETHFDVVLMDVQMPVLGGFEATAKIRALEADGLARTPIIAMTAHAMEGDREKCLAAGMDGYVSKPIQTDMLITALDEVIAGDQGPAVGDPMLAPPTAVAVLGPLFNRSAMLENLGDDIELLATLSQLFIDDLPRGFAALDQAVSVADAAEILVAAHTLKGAAANFGAAPVVECLVQLENAARKEKMDEIPALAEQSKGLLERLAAELKT
jgi:CheY-like chemotaxis protein/HPt (histidine-containing phosphotransfer) domain-containing protein